MTPKSDTGSNTRISSYRGLAATEIQRKQEREQALDWVSHNALSSVQNKWCRARLNDRRLK
jgi:hypothetical protein